MRRAPIELASAGTPRSDPFRSEYERRAAAALTRLGIRWAYEPDTLTWRDARNTLHVYTPDFALLDLHDTYVEIKGPAGADAVDTLKMQRVLAWHPSVTLLLWDAAIVDYLEDVTDASALLGLLRTTKAA